MEEDKFLENFQNCDCGSSSTSGKSICWLCIQHFLESETENLVDDERSKQIVNFLLRILIEYDCNDKSIFYSCIVFYFRFHFLTCRRHLEANVTDGYERNVDSILEQFKVLKSDTKDGLLSVVKADSLPVCLTDSQFFSFLAKYGIVFEESIFNMENAKKLFRDFWLAVQRDVFAEIMIQQNPEIMIEFYEGISGIILKEYQNPQNWLTVNGSQRDKRYIYLIVKTLEIVTALLEDKDYVSVMSCCRTFYRTIPDPFARRDDIIKFLEELWRMFSPVIGLNFRTVEQIFEKSPDRYTPRSLKHLCRISLRHILTKNLKLLPHYVRRLDTPRDLHDYILCIEPFVGPEVNIGFDDEGH